MTIVFDTEILTRTGKNVTGLASLFVIKTTESKISATLKTINYKKTKYFLWIPFPTKRFGRDLLKKVIDQCVEYNCDSVSYLSLRRTSKNLHKLLLERGFTEDSGGYVLTLRIAAWRRP